MAVNTRFYSQVRMIVSERVAERMKRLGLSQSELARRVGVAQPTIYKLLRSNKIGSKHLHRIARELQTSPAYLEGEIDDPDKDAPPPQRAPIIRHLMMPVALPSEAALSTMFEAQLRVFGDLQGAELAHALARRLPSALGRLQAAELYEETVDDEPRSEEQSPPAQAHPEPQRARRR